MEQDRNEHAEGESSIHAEEVSLLPFIRDVKTLFKIEEMKDKLRVTPAGLFIDEGLRPKLIEKYQEWLLKKTQGAVVKSERKCFKRLFGSEEPPEYYLVEGKNCLLGYLVACPVQQPQSMGIPFYLGSLTETRNYVHPRDPRLAAMENLELAATSDGMELQVQVRGRTYRMQTPFLLTLRELAEHSPHLLRQFPELPHALRETVRAAVKLLKRAALVEKKQQILVPQRLANAKQMFFLRSGTLVFAAERGERLVECYELKGASLNHLIRQDLRAVTGGQKRGAHLGSLEIIPRDPRRIGSLRIRGEQFFVAPRALQDFVERVLDYPPLRSRLPARYTVAMCIEEFCVICQQSEQIAKAKIARHVEQLKLKANRFYTYERWLLVIGDGNTILRCIDKGAPSAHGHGHGRAHGPPDRPHRK